MNKNVSTNENKTDILIVEDSPIQAADIKYLLESYQFTVMIAQNGLQALVWLSKNIPLLVISNIVMPGMNGFELCAKIKSDERTKDIPVILLTTHTDPDEAVEGLLCGADNFITKPYDKKFLLYNIEEIILGKPILKSKSEAFRVEINHGGKKRLIRSEPQKVVKLLLRMYQSAILKNNELIQTREELRRLNQRIEDLVEERAKEI
jgi:response regulator RpfG family c-di-GMP phosphodiesterase